MPGVGFVLFVLPVLFGGGVGVVFLLLPRLKRFAAYAFLIPIVGALGALAGSFAGAYAVTRVLTSQTAWPSVTIFVLCFVLGAAMGSTCGALVAKQVSRLIG